MSVGSANAIGLVNPGFEIDLVDDLKLLSSPDLILTDGSDPGFVIVTQDNSLSGTNITGWRTTAGDNGIELWESGFIAGAANAAFSAPDGGSQFAELNATEETTLFQNLPIAASAGTTQLYFSFLHRARSTGAGSTNVNAVNVQILDGATPLFNEVFATQLIDNGSANQTNNGWARYTSSDFTIPILAAAGTARNITYRFSAVSLTGGNAAIFSTTGLSPTRTFNATGINTTNSDLSFGNFIDTANLSDDPATVGVPFDFEANTGIATLGALFFARKAFKSWKSKKDN